MTPRTHAFGADTRFPGIPATADGSEAVVWVETHVSQGACAYPITSSTNMGAGYQAAQAAGKKNLWGEPLFFLELESEHSSASTCEGFALSGGRVTNFTSGQGLVLMKEVLYTIAGKRLPVVFHVGARALSSQAFNVHCGHDDVMAVASRAFPLFTYDPRRGATIRERLSLQGNPDLKEEWHRHPKTGELVDFIAFARTERRFARQFGPGDTPSAALLAAREDRLANWRRLQELAGVE